MRVIERWHSVSGRFRRIFRRDDLDYEFLPPALEIEETPSSPIKRLLIWLIFALTCAVVAWSCLGKVDEVAVARGKIIPDGRVKVIQPLETGVIRAIYVSEGQRVQEGQALIELDHTIKQADVESSGKTLSIHEADRERLRAELTGRQIGRTRGTGETPAEFAEVQRGLKEAREAEFRAREDALKLVITQRENALGAAGAMLVKLEKTKPVVEEQERAYRTLFEKGCTARVDWLERQKELHAVTQELEAQGKICGQARDSLEEARQNLEALRRERKRTILSELVDREKEITTASGEVAKARKRFELESLCSPVRGTVHGLSSYTIGGVVTPAQPVVTIVPDGTPLVVEAMALNKDVGFLREGQEAEIKFDTFPFQKYGTIKGRVVWISPDCIEDEKQGAVYKLRVQPEKLTMYVNGRDVSITPGMALTVEVKTNQRRIIEFFLSPLVKYAKESLTLR